MAALSRRDGVLFCRPDGRVLAVEPVDVGWLSGALEKAALPVSGKILLEGADEAQARTLAMLVAGRVLVEAPAPGAAAHQDRKPCRHLVMGISGAVQAIHAPTIVLPLFYHFCERMDLVFTEASKRFVVPEVFGYFGIGVWTDGFASRGSTRVPHMDLARSAELVLVAPASAATIHRLATGACSDLLSLVVSATDAPVVVAPAMNGAMWRKGAIRRNVARLREDGVSVVEPSTGIEVSSGAEAVPEPGGMGLSAANLLPTLTAVLATARASDGTAGTGAGLKRRAGPTSAKRR